MGIRSRNLNVHIGAKDRIREVNGQFRCRITGQLVIGVTARIVCNRPTGHSGTIQILVSAHVHHGGRALARISGEGIVHKAGTLIQVTRDMGRYCAVVPSVNTGRAA